MPQIKFHTTPEFEQQLALLMRLKSLPSKSEAIRLAVAGQARIAQLECLRRDFGSLVGLIEPRRKGRFSSNDELWSRDRDDGR